VKNFVIILSQLFFVFNLAHADSPPSPVPNPIGVVQATGSLLNANVLVVNPAQSPVPVTGNLSLTIPYSGATGSSVPSNAAFIGGKDGSGNLQGLKVNSSQALTVDGSSVTQPVSATSLPLPAGASTSALQSSLITALGSPFQAGGSIGNTSFACTQASGSSLHVDVDNFPSSQAVTGTFWQTTQPVSAASLPLPTGASTSALQTTGNTTLSTISGQLPTTLGAKTTTNSIAVNIASDQTVPVSGTITTSPNVNMHDGSGTAINSTSNALNVSVENASIPVTGTFFQATQPVSASALPLPTGASTSALQTTGNTLLTTVNTTLGSPFQAGGSIANTTFASTQSGAWSTGRTWSLLNSTDSVNAVQSGTWNLGNISGTISLPTGASTSALQTTGNTTLSSIEAGIPAGLGSTVSANSMPVVIASDQSTINTAPTGNTVTASLTGSSTSNITTTGYGTIRIDIEGSWTGQINFFQSTDGTNFYQANCANDLTLDGQVYSFVTSASGYHTFKCDVTGVKTFQLSPNVSITGTAVTTMIASPGVGIVTAILANTFVSGTVNAKLQDGSGNSITEGQKAAASSLPVTLSNEDIQDQFITGQSTQTATVNNILTTASGTAATDTMIGTSGVSYRSFSVQVTSTGTAGTFIFEGSNDNVNFQPIPVVNQALLTSTPLIAAITASSSQIVYAGPIFTRYIRLRIATTITGGSIQAFARLSMTPYTPQVQNVAQATAANLNVTVGSGTVTTVSTVSSVTASNNANPTLVADIASGAIATTTTSATITPSTGIAYQVNIPVTVVSGTNPTMSIEVDESSDTGTNWYAVYTFPTITATGSYNSPTIQLTGNRIKYVQTIGGTASPSFTRAINRLQSSQAAPKVSGFVGALTDGSGSTSGTPSTSTQIFAANPARHYLMIQNLDATNTIWINFGSAATAGSGSIALTAGASLFQETNGVSNQTVNVLSAAASVNFTAKQE
jgi:hypothetical protein